MELTAQRGANMHRQRLRLSLSHVADGEWRCVFTGDNPMLAPQ